MTQANHDAKRLGIASRLFIALQYFLPQILLTRVIAWLALREERWLKNFLVRTFARQGLGDGAADPA